MGKSISELGINLIGWRGLWRREFPGVARVTLPGCPLHPWESQCQFSIQSTFTERMKLDDTDDEALEVTTVTLLCVIERCW